MAATETILALDEISAFYGELQAMFDIDLELRRGDILALIGANGAGKSTLLRTITGLTAVGGKTRLTGRMRFEGQAIERLPPLQRTILTLYHLDELPLAQIARITGLAEGTLKSHLFRSRKRLQEWLAPALGAAA